MTTRSEILLHVERMINEQIVPHFNPEARFTLLVRVPGNDRADVMLTTDDRDGALAALTRSFGRKDQQVLVREGFTPWAGGVNPAGFREVYFWRRDGEAGVGYASDLTWQHLGHATDIISWRYA